MKLVLLSDKQANQMLAMPIYTENGLVYLNKGKVLTERNISYIQKIGITYIYIEDESNDLILEEVLPSEIKNRLVKRTKNLFAQAFKTKRIEESEVTDIITDIIENLIVSENAILINSIALDDNLTEQAIFSINQTIYALILGLSLEYSVDKLKSLAIAAFLHSLHESQEGTELHMQTTYKMIRECTNFSATISTSVLFAYEAVDGSGPFKKTDEAIYEYAKIIKIVHDYTKTLDEGKMPHEAVEYLMAGASRLYDFNLVSQFTKNIYCYPNALPVVLNNGVEGIVVRQNKDLPIRPIICTKDRQLIDLGRELTLFIDKVIL